MGMLSLCCLLTGTFLPLHLPCHASNTWLSKHLSLLWLFPQQRQPAFWLLQKLYKLWNNRYVSQLSACMIAISGSCSVQFTGVNSVALAALDHCILLPAGFVSNAACEHACWVPLIPTPVKFVYAYLQGSRSKSCHNTCKHDQVLCVLCTRLLLAPKLHHNNQLTMP